MAEITHHDAGRGREARRERTFRTRLDEAWRYRRPVVVTAMMPAVALVVALGLLGLSTIL